LPGVSTPHILPTTCKGVRETKRLSESGIGAVPSTNWLSLSGKSILTFEGMRKEDSEDSALVM